MLPKELTWNLIITPLNSKCRLMFMGNVRKYTIYIDPMNRQRWFGKSWFSMVFQVRFLHWKCQFFCHHPQNGYVVKSGGLFGMLPIHDPTCTWTDKSFSGSNPPNTRIIKEILYLLNRRDFRTILTVFCVEEIVHVYRWKQGRSLKKSPWNSPLFLK